jgi:hypothetical protein
MTATTQNSDLDELDKPVWGAEAIGALIGKPRAATFHLLETGKIPARRIGRQWVTTKRRLREHFNAAQQAAR